jgi:hypothetical protein
VARRHVRERGGSENLWLIPPIHIICVALVFSSVVMIEFRVLGCTRSGTVADAARRFVPWIYACIVVMALTGAVLIVGEPERPLPSFENPDDVPRGRTRLHHFLLAFGAHARGSLGRQVEHAHRSYDARRPRARRVVVAGALSLLFWIGVVYFARTTGFTMVQGGA